MPTVDASLNDLCGLIGKKLSKEELGEALLFAKAEIDSSEGDALKIDVKDSNRPDLWSAEGIARELRFRLGLKKGLPKYSAAKPKVSVFVEKSVEKVRPKIAVAIAKNVNVTEDFLIQLIQLQEKVAGTFGRKRKEAAIGIFDFDKITWPIYYRAVKDNEVEFVPLEFNVKMRPSEILKEHPKGKEYAHLLDEKNFPIFIDAAKEVLSMPPIINSDWTGKVTEKTKNIYLEVSGYRQETVNTALNVLAMALADRGAKLEAVNVVYGQSKKIVTPQFGVKKKLLDPKFAEKLAGIELSERQIIECLSRAGMDAKKKGSKLEVTYPDYRQDVLHEVDLIEDVLISYGYRNFKPQKIELAVTGKELPQTRYLDVVREACIGMGLQEVLTFNLTSREKQEAKIGLKEEKFVEIANPVSLNYSLFRKRLLPELLEFLGKNKDKEFPQMIFEVGRALELDAKSETSVKEKNSLCIVSSHKEAGFTEAKSLLETVCSALGLKYELSETKLPFLKAGRGAELKVNGKKGFIGELNEKTLKEFGLEMPVSAVELEL
ncbi:MAG: phenylalanine--tRNA ligase subunit beta [Candidatus Diapherotrites archaeon]